MKAYRVSPDAEIERLPFVANHRQGDLPAENLRRQAAGEMDRPTPPDLRPARFLHTITLSDGRFADFASDPGALLTFVITGTLTLTKPNGESVELLPGDVALVDAESAAHLTAEAGGTCRLIQLGVASNWPDAADAKVQDEGTDIPRGEVTLKRIRKADDDRSYFHAFPELFAARPNEWSAPRPIIGFRFMCWEDGYFDWHPEVVNHLGIVLAGELAVEASGDHTEYVFRAGDVLLAEDRTGMGHVNRSRGKIYVALVQVETVDLW